MKRRLIHPRKKQKILERDNFKCVNCGCSGDFNALEVDHIVSVKDNGSDDESNLQTLCYKCNMAKFHKKNVTNKYFLDLTPVQKLDLIKKRLIEYKHLTYAEFKVIFTQDELFGRLRVGLGYLEELFREISGNKRKKQVEPFRNQKRDALIGLLREKTGFTYQEMSDLLKIYDINISLPQIGKICTRFSDISKKKAKISSNIV